MTVYERLSITGLGPPRRHVWAYNVRDIKPSEAPEGSWRRFLGGADRVIIPVCDRDGEPTGEIIMAEASEVVKRASATMNVHYARLELS